MVDMAKRPPERHRKVPPVTINDIQKTTNDNLEATRHSFEHATTSFGGATRVTQEIAKQIADYSKHSFEQGSKTLENLLTAKSPDKAFEVQTEYAKAAYESYVSHATKLGQLYIDLAQETFKSYQDFAPKLTPVR
jgi:hypothetical protein